jgi:DNA (cytosine-5)-methyltransferase 1
VGALSAAAYVKYTDQEFVRQGQLVTGEDLIRTGKNAEVIKRTGDDTYYIEDVERGPVKAGGAGGGPPRSDRLPLITYRKSRRAQSVEDAESRVDDGIANTLNQFDTGDTRTTHAVVSVGGDIAHTLTKEGHDAGEDRTGRGTPVVSFYSTGGSHNGFARTDGLSPTLKVGSGLGIPSPPAVAFSHYSSDPGPGAVSPTMRSGTNVSGHAVQYGPTVRRLTPMECERLMAFPDGWTDVPWNKKDHSPDSRRYAACGNGVVSTVAWWIGARLAEVLRES